MISSVSNVQGEHRTYTPLEILYIEHACLVGLPTDLSPSIMLKQEDPCMIMLLYVGSPNDQNPRDQAMVSGNNLSRTYLVYVLMSAFDTYAVVKLYSQSLITRTYIQIACQYAYQPEGLLSYLYIDH